MASYLELLSRASYLVIVGRICLAIQSEEKALFKDSFLILRFTAGKKRRLIFLLYITRTNNKAKHKLHIHTHTLKEKKTKQRGKY